MVMDGRRIRAFVEWGIDLKHDQIENGDRYSFKTWLSHIVGAWRSHYKQCEEKETEIGCRKGIDDLIETAFVLRAEAQNIWRYVTC